MGFVASGKYASDPVFTTAPPSEDDLTKFTFLSSNLGLSVPCDLSIDTA